MTQSATQYQHQFSAAPVIDRPSRSRMFRPFVHKTTFNASRLYPIGYQMMYPGDSVHCKVEAFVRMTTPIFPIMDNIRMDIFHFFVPMRLVWDHWQQFMGEKDDFVTPTVYTIPQWVAPAGGFTAGKLADYMGIPLGIAGLSVSHLPVRAYRKIWNDWFRPEKFTNPTALWNGNTTDDDSVYDNHVLSICKRHDYFTSLLPEPLDGDPVLISGADSPVYGDGNVLGLTDGTLTGGLYNPAGMAGAIWVDQDLYGDPVGTATAGLLSLTADAGLGVVQSPGDSGLVAQLGVSIMDLREAVALQKFREALNRGGHRYTEINRAIFGVTSPDSRLQRAEFLSSQSQYINITSVPQTSSTDATSPQGNIAAYSVTRSSGGFSFAATEHGYWMSVMCVRADLTYQNGIERSLSYLTREEFYWPWAAGLSDQAVLQKEIFADGSANDDLVFGYSARYDEMRYSRSYVSGLFRSNAAGTLDSWHLAENFTAAQTLNAAFLYDKTIDVLDRCLAVTDEDQFIGEFYFQLDSIRPMPMYGIPGMGSSL